MLRPNGECSRRTKPCFVQSPHTPVQIHYLRGGFELCENLVGLGQGCIVDRIFQSVVLLLKFAKLGVKAAILFQQFHVLFMLPRLMQ